MSTKLSGVNLSNQSKIDQLKGEMRALKGDNPNNSKSNIIQQIASEIIKLRGNPTADGMELISSAADTSQDLKAFKLNLERDLEGLEKKPNQGPTVASLRKQLAEVDGQIEELNDFPEIQNLQKEMTMEMMRLTRGDTKTQECYVENKLTLGMKRLIRMDPVGSAGKIHQLAVDLLQIQARNRVGNIDSNSEATKTSDATPGGVALLSNSMSSLGISPSSDLEMLRILNQQLQGTALNELQEIADIAAKIEKLKGANPGISGANYRPPQRPMDENAPKVIPVQQILANQRRPQLLQPSVLAKQGNLQRPAPGAQQVVPTRIKVESKTLKQVSTAGCLQHLQASVPVKQGNLQRPAPGAQQVVSTSIKVESKTLKQVSTAATNFGRELFAQLAGRDGKSCAISPISIIGALALGLEVIEDKVAYLEKLGLAGMSVEDAHTGFAELLRASSLDDRSGLITIAQAVAAQSLDFVTEELSAIVKDTYSGEIFTPTEGGSVCDVVNQWVSEKTKGNIKELLTEPRTEMALLNAIYLQLQWRLPVVKPNDGWSKEQFTLGDGSIISDVPMMKQTGCFQLLEAKEYSMLELPYKAPNGRQLSHLIFLPTLTPGQNPLEAVNHLQSLLTYKGIQDCRKNAGFEMVKVSMPRTVQETDLDLLETLRGMGFPLDKLIAHLEERNLKIGGIKHKTFVKTNEEGSIAAAVTSINIEAKFYVSNINVNHPFISCIMDGDTVLFIGRVSDASALDLTN